MGLLGFERGVSILAQLVGFDRELDGVIALAKDNGAIDDPVLRDRLAGLKAELEVMRFTALRSLSAVTAGDDSSAGGGAASIFKLVWANWHKRLGEVAMDVRGLDGLAGQGAAPYELDDWQRLFLFSRSDTIYGGSDEVQRNILAERVLGLPREPKGDRDDDRHRAEQPVPDYVPGHDLLAGKVVVVTAAAGAGIGAAVVRRALEEGAKAVVFSDTHERRLAEAEEALAAEFGKRPGAASWSAT